MIKANENVHKIHLSPAFNCCGAGEGVKDMAVARRALYRGAEFDFRTKLRKVCEFILVFAQCDVR